MPTAFLEEHSYKTSKEKYGMQYVKNNSSDVWMTVSLFGTAFSKSAFMLNDVHPNFKICNGTNSSEISFLPIKI